MRSQQLEQQAQEVAHHKQELAQQEVQLASSRLQLEVRLLSTPLMWNVHADCSMSKLMLDIAVVGWVA